MTFPPTAGLLPLCVCDCCCALSPNFCFCLADVDAIEQKKKKKGKWDGGSKRDEKVPAHHHHSIKLFFSFSLVGYYDSLVLRLLPGTGAARSLGHRFPPPTSLIAILFFYFHLFILFFCFIPPPIHFIRPCETTELIELVIFRNLINAFTFTMRSHSQSIIQIGCLLWCKWIWIPAIFFFCFWFFFENSQSICGYVAMYKWEHTFFI